MMEKTIVTVGTFAMRPDVKKGLHVFKYNNENGSMEYLTTELEDKNIGFQYYDVDSDTLFATHEWKDDDGQGKLLSIKVNKEDGSVSLQQAVPTLAPQPCFIEGEGSGKFLMVPHHGSNGKATKIVKNERGEYAAQQVYEDVSLDIFEKGNDGRIIGLSDVTVFTRIEGNNNSHLHSAALSPNGKMLLVPDKGKDKIWIFEFDSEKGKADCKRAIEVSPGSHPRYALFHPNLPVFYANNEARAFIDIYRYDEDSLETELIGSRAATMDEQIAENWKKEGASDIKINKEASRLYLSVRGLNIISVYDINPKNGDITLIQNISCNGENPRSIALSPDEKYLFATNRDTNNISRYKVLEDGRLEAEGEISCHMPCNIMFL